MTCNPSGCCWYVLRTTYGRERKAYDYITSQGAEAFYPTTRRRHLNHQGKLIHQEMSLLPNIFFLHATLRVAQEFVYDNVHLPYLRFYYDQHHDGSKEPLIVPDHQIDNLRRLCSAQSEDTLFVPNTVDKFRIGQHVHIIAGKFKGVTGVVSRWCGQQRVGIELSGIGIIATAYVPSAFLENVDEK